MTQRCFLFFCLGFLIFSGGLNAQAPDTFSGSVDFVNKNFELTLNLKGNNTVSIRSVPTAEGRFQLQTKIEHLTVAGSDLSSLLESSVEEIKNPRDGSLFWHGAIESKYSLINYKPASELTGSFEIKGNRFYLNSATWGEAVVHGFIDLSLPYEIDLVFELTDARAADLSQFSGCHDANTALPTSISGQLRVSGFLNKPYLRGRFIAYGGAVQGVSYDSLTVNFEGFYPTVKVFDSNIVQTDGLSFNINGDFELKNSCQFGSDLSKLRMSPIVDETNFQRQWTIKKKQEEGSSSATELKYLLRKNLNKDTGSPEDSGMLGVERSIRF